MVEQVLVFDFGTSYFKAALVSATGDVVRLARVPTPVKTTGRTRTIDLSTFRSTAAALASQLEDLTHVRAVTFSTQANTFALLDKHDRPITPLIVWNDQRAGLFGHVWTADDRHRTGIGHLTSDFSVAKIGWVAKHEPQTLLNTRRLMYLGDAFVHWLTGAHATDHSVAWLSAMYDLRHRDWDDALVARAGLKRQWLPEIVKAGTSLGRIRPEAASQLGLPRDSVLIMGLLDQFAGAVGVGNVGEGDLSETTGTVLATVHCTREPSTADDQLLTGPACSDGLFYRMAVSGVSGRLLEGVRAHVNMSLEALDASASFPSRLRLDETKPLHDVREQITGWLEREPVGDVVSSIYAAVARTLASHVRRLDSHGACAVLSSAGGAARSQKWLQLKADTLGLPIRSPATDEPAILGAASFVRAPLGWSSPPPPPGRPHLIRPRLQRPPMLRPPYGAEPLR